MNMKLNIISSDLFVQYSHEVNSHVQENFEKLHDSELSIATFSFYTSVSAVFSSRIEGEDIEMDSYIKHKRFGAHFSPDHTRKTDDLYEAYTYAQTHKLNERNLLHAHGIITRHILQQAQQGALRKGNMYVITGDGKIEYVAASPATVPAEMKALLKGINTLLKANLSFTEVLFYAALIHLVFVKIHPFEDGNGRTARLLEKWFIAEKLGPKAWFIQSEKNYYTNHKQYYTNIRKLGLEYDTLDYSQALPFLLMLPQSMALP